MNNSNRLNPGTQSALDPQFRQDRFLRVFLMGASIFGLLAILATLINPIAPVNETIYVAAFAIVIVLTFMRSAYGLRAGIVLALLYILGLWSLFDSGVGGSAQVFLLALIVVSGLLFSFRVSIPGLVVSLLTIAISGWLLITQQVPLSAHLGSAPASSDWISAGISFLILGGLIVAALHLLQSELGNAETLAASSLQSLKTEGLELETRAGSLTQEKESRDVQLRATLYFNSQISEVQDTSLLLRRSVELISQRFGYYHVGIFLLDNQQKIAFLQAASSVPGQELLTKGYRVNVGDQNVIGRAVESGKLVQSGGQQTRATTKDTGELSRTRSQVAMPLISRGKVIGVLDIQSEQANAFGQSQVEILHLLADKVSTSLDNLRLLTESQAIVNEFEVLSSQQTRLAWKGYSKGQNYAYQFTPAGVKVLPASYSGEMSENSLSVPLVLRGQEIGSIRFRRPDSSHWSGEERDLAEKISGQVSLALENRRLLNETRQSAIQEQTVSEISARLNRSLDIDTLLQSAARELGALPEVGEVSVFIGELDRHESDK
jgi:GAF domain-containing protein